MANRSPLLRVSEKEIALVRSTLSMGGEESIKRDVDMVLEWYEKQHHLPRVPLDRDFVERMLIARKGSVEQTKHRIDLIFTLRTLIPDMASPRDVLHPDIQRQFESVVFAVMPKLSHELTRVTIYKIMANSDAFVLADTIKYMFMTLEYRLKYDYALGERFIFDFQHITLAHVTKLNPVAFKKGEALLNGYGSRVFGFHYINAPPYVGTIINIVKSAMSAKLVARIVVHPTLDELHHVVTKSILPKEYGGEEPSLEEFAEQWKEEFGKEDIRRYLLQQETMRSDEALRVEQRASDEMLGIPGSFKAIDVD